MLSRDNIMYYSYKCTYCGRLFYTYSVSKEDASAILYKAIKQHLTDYNEDHKEYEMDDGAQADSDQIYYGMSESKTIPAGGYEAIVHEGGTSSGVGASMTLFYIVLFMLLAGVVIFFLFGGFQFRFPQF